MLVADAPRPPTLALAFLAGLTALAAWALVSVLWSPGAAAPVLEAERGLLYVTAVAAALLLLVRGDAAAPLLGGIVAGAVAAALYALATRFFPGHVGGAYDPSSGYQLAEPIGYWNALGLLCALALLLATALAAHARRLAARALAAAALVVLLPALYFTFSRGALAALVAAAVLQVALDPRRARLVAVALVTGAPAALGVLYASRFHALTTAGDSLTTAQREGRQVATALVVLALAAAAAAVALDVVQRRTRIPARAGTFLVGGLAAAAAVAVVAALVAVGGPRDALDRATSSFREPLTAGGGDLQGRLLSASGNGREEYWRVAWESARDEPLLGTGAGSFETEWLRERPVAFDARDAHNLYLETLAELGPVGLLLLVVTLALPLVALLRARTAGYAAAAGSAYVAFVLHAAVDWDWELPVVVVPALLCAAVVLCAGGLEEEPWLTGRRQAVALAALAPIVAVALVAHAGNRATRAAEDALEDGDAARALDESRTATRWAPWSDEAWVHRASAQLGLGEREAARTSLHEAVRLNSENWSAWLALAALGEAGALDRARRLNPLDPAVEELREELQTEP